MEKKEEQRTPEIINTLNPQQPVISGVRSGVGSILGTLEDSRDAFKKIFRDVFRKPGSIPIEAKSEYDLILNKYPDILKTYSIDGDNLLIIAIIGRLVLERGKRETISGPSINFVDYLLEKGIGANILDVDGENGLPTCMMMNSSDTLETLLKAGANPNQESNDGKDMVELAIEGRKESNLGPLPDEFLEIMKKYGYIEPEKRKKQPPEIKNDPPISQEDISKFTDECKDKNVDIISITNTEIQIKSTKKEFSNTTRSKASFDEKTRILTLKCDEGDVYTDLHWEKKSIKDLMKDEDRVLVLENYYECNCQEIRDIIVINSNKEKSYLIPLKSGNGFISICSSGKFHAYITNEQQNIGTVVRKPVIYLYPKKETKVDVNLTLNGGKFTTTYPSISNGKWTVLANSRGKLKDIGTNKKYDYLFWEANYKDGFTINNDNAFCVKDSEVCDFLEKSLKTFGLNSREINDFMTYWLPILERNKYSLIEWKTKEYTDKAKLMINPNPDTLIRIFMVFKKSEKQIKTGNPKLSRMKRKGFTVVEWGGSNLDE